VTAGTAPRCANCRFFVRDPVEVERALPGLTALGSARGCSFGDQGLCRKAGLLLTPDCACKGFESLIRIIDTSKSIDKT